MNRPKLARTAVLVLSLIAGCANGAGNDEGERAPETGASTNMPGASTTAGDAATGGASDGGGGDGSGTASDPSSVVAIGTGAGHTCVLTGGGVVKCWGESSYGQIGTGVFTHPSVKAPFTVPGLGFVTAIAVAGHHTCALEQDGVAKCWGGNELGTVGDGTVVERRYSPTSVLGLAAGGAISTKVEDGFLRNVSLTNTGGDVEWGAFIDDVDVNAATAQTTATPVTGLAGGVTAVAAGDLHACAVTSAGGVECWGYNVHGQCGDGSANNARPT
jgi:alpha-tubulin suppressor-like RCC1 family protein